MPSAMAAMRACVSRSRSSITSEMLPRAASTSAALASRMAAQSFSSASAMAMSAAFFFSVPAVASSGHAALAFLSISRVVMRASSP